MKPIALYYRVLQYQPENLALLDQLFTVRSLIDPGQDTADVLNGVEVLFAPLGFPVDGTRMDQCGRLRAIASNTTGIPHIDTEAARARGVVVCALHDEPAFLDTITPTAEHAIGLLMAVWRRIPAAHRAASSGQWNRRPWAAQRMLSRMRLGIVGFGRLGRKVAAVGQALGMDVAYYDPFVPDGMSSLMALAARSDVLSLHAPANDHTRGIVSRAVLEALPAGAVVVNTARGELLDLDALLDLLERGHLAGAALDTIDGEYAPKFSEGFAASRAARVARERDNLILTPHIGGSTVDAWRETERFVVEKAARALRLAAAP